MIWIQNLLRGFGWRFSSQSQQIFHLALYYSPVGLQFISAEQIFLVSGLNANFVSRKRTDGVSRELKDTLKGFGMSQLINEPTSDH